MTPLPKEEQGAIIRQFGGNRRNMIKWLKKNLRPGEGVLFDGRKLVRFTVPAFGRLPSGKILQTR